MAPDPDDLSHLHEPVFVQEVLAYLLGEGRVTTGLVVDATVGAGGHAVALLEARPGLRVLGIDRDPQAVVLGRARLARFGERARVVHGSYATLDELLARAGEGAPRGVLLDLGVSSMQLDDPARGFSFRGGDHAPDMRFDAQGAEPSAQEFVNTASERELARVLFEYGEEPRARSVARAILRARPILTLEQLRAVVSGAALRVRRHDPATRSFQGLRIAVNDEFGHVERGLRKALAVLAPHGRLVVLCFHSGEERLVKQAFREAVAGGRGRVLTRKPIRPGREEVERNPRARPARLRAFEVSGEE